jgi:hypothetical protein
MAYGKLAQHPTGSLPQLRQMVHDSGSADLALTSVIFGDGTAAEILKQAKHSVRLLNQRINHQPVFGMDMGELPPSPLLLQPEPQPQPQPEPGPQPEPEPEPEPEPDDTFYSTIASPGGLLPAMGDANEDILEEDPGWYYQGKDGETQGPQPLENMQQWFEHGDLPAGVLVRRGLEGDFEDVIEFREICDAEAWAEEVVAAAAAREQRIAREAEAARAQAARDAALEAAAAAKLEASLAAAQNLELAEKAAAAKTQELQQQMAAMAREHAAQLAAAQEAAAAKVVAEVSALEAKRLADLRAAEEAHGALQARQLADQQFAEQAHKAQAETAEIARALEDKMAAMEAEHAAQAHHVMSFTAWEEKVAKMEAEHAAQLAAVEKKSAEEREAAAAAARKLAERARQEALLAAGTQSTTSTPALSAATAAAASVERARQHAAEHPAEEHKLQAVAQSQSDDARVAKTAQQEQKTPFPQPAAVAAIPQETAGQQGKEPWPGQDSDGAADADAAVAAGARAAGAKVVEEDEEEDEEQGQPQEWYYQGTAGETQGPQPLESMQQWFEHGYLPAGVLVRRGVNGVFMDVHTYPEICGIHAEITEDDEPGSASSSGE